MLAVVLQHQVAHLGEDRYEERPFREIGPSVSTPTACQTSSVQTADLVDTVSRMVLWKQYVILCGGFIDVGIKSRVHTGKPSQVADVDCQQTTCPTCGYSTWTSLSGSRSSTSTRTEHPGTYSMSVYGQCGTDSYSARSGFSFVPCAEGAILHGGYKKEYLKGTKPKGVPLADTWLLRSVLPCIPSFCLIEGQDGQ